MTAVAREKHSIQRRRNPPCRLNLIAELPPSGLAFDARHRSLCKAAAVTVPLRVVTYPVRMLACLRRGLCREQARTGYGLPYAICVIVIYGVSFSKGAGLSVQRERTCSVCVLI